MLNVSVVMAMTGLAGFYAPLALIGQKKSTHTFYYDGKISEASINRVKEMLRSGHYSVAGDQWPVLLYKDEIYDPERPWVGLFKNRLLVLVNIFGAIILLLLTQL